MSTRPRSVPGEDAPPPTRAVGPAGAMHGAIPLPADLRPFRPAFGLGNPHVQTILGKFLRPAPEVTLRRERIDTPDGDFLDLDFVLGAAPDSPPVVVLHGLEGATSRRYVRNTFRRLLDAGLAPVGLNFRGCSGDPNRTARAYHSGETGDLGTVLDLVARRYGRPAGLVGFSLGGNVTLKLLGERRETAGDHVGAAVAVSVPFDLAAGCDCISSGVMGRVYTRYFMRSLLGKIEGKAHLLEEACDLAAVRRARTLREFDEVATAPLHGFRDAADYYARASSAGFIEGIRVPTLIIHAEDDPFLRPESIPRSAMDANPWVTAAITRRGGHVGFLEGSLRRPRFWVEDAIAAWLARALGARPDS